MRRPGCTAGAEDVAVSLRHLAHLEQIQPPGRRRRKLLDEALESGASMA
jgi:hypothetical protein